MTHEARECGVRIGMRRGGALAIAPGLTLHERDEAREQAALQSTALMLLQYTPELALGEDATLLLDARASLRLFGGHRALCRRVRHSVAAMGFTTWLGAAPTAHGASLLARHHRKAKSSRQRRAVRMTTMTRLLDALPFHLLTAAQPYYDLLAGIGCANLADLRQLPRAGLQRRCDTSVLNALDRAYGDAVELFDWVQAPPNFAARLELPDRIDYAQALLFGARRLILQMTGWLRARQLAVTRFVLMLEHERGRCAVAPTSLEIALAQASWQEAHLTTLLKENLERMTLPAPVIALRLEAAQLTPMEPPSASLFPEPGGSAADFNRLLELLTARLGAESVLMPAPQADYRPEIGNAWKPAAQWKRHSAWPIQKAERPFWLLEKPIALRVRDHRPFYGSPLKLVSGPERIECGWWDDAFATRDYFIALGTDSAYYWIYRQRFDVEERWFLHGLFA
jgi:protein ImuB